MLKILNRKKLQILTNGLYESTLHRVINKSAKYRVCVAYFYEVESHSNIDVHICVAYNLIVRVDACYQPNYDAAVEALDICVQKSGGAKKLDRAVYGKHLVSKVVNNFIM